ncbi:Fur family transcriptional regulator [Planctomycetota bacterium]
MPDPRDAQTLLKEAGLYCTAARVAVIEALASADHPLSQDQIAQAMASHPDKVTIYRTLTSLMKSNLVHRAYVDERAAYYELAHHCGERQCHPHFTCTNCGQTHCLTELKIPLAETPHKGFKIQRQQVRLEGLCPACA